MRGRVLAAARATVSAAFAATTAAAVSIVAARAAAACAAAHLAYALFAIRGIATRRSHATSYASSLAGCAWSCHAATRTPSGFSVAAVTEAVASTAASIATAAARIADADV